MGVFVARDEGELRRLFELAKEYGSYIVEPMLPGREFSVGILEIDRGQPRALPILEASAPNSEFLDTKAKYGGANLVLSCPAALGGDEQLSLARLAIHTYLAVGCYPLARIDFREDADGKPQLLEVNHFPGMTPHSWMPFIAAKAGMSFDHLLLELMVSALEVNGVEGFVPKQVNACSGIIRKTEGPIVVVFDEEEPSISSAQSVESELDNASIVAFADLVRMSSQERVDNAIYDCLYNPEHQNLIFRGALDALQLRRIGPSLLTCALTEDKVKQKIIAKALNTPLPDWDIAADLEEDLRFCWPLVLKNRWAGCSRDLYLVDGPATWRALQQRLFIQEDRRWIVEEYLPGAEFCVFVVTLANGQFLVLPVFEVEHEKGTATLNDVHNKARGAVGIRPAQLTNEVETWLREQTLVLHGAFDSSPFARVEWRAGRNGIPCLIEYDATPGLAVDSYLPRALGFGGVSLRQLLCDLVPISDARISW